MKQASRAVSRGALRAMKTTARSTKSGEAVFHSMARANPACKPQGDVGENEKTEPSHVRGIRYWASCVRHHPNIVEVHEIGVRAPDSDFGKQRLPGQRLDRIDPADAHALEIARPACHRSGPPNRPVAGRLWRTSSMGRLSMTICPVAAAGDDRGQIFVFRGSAGGGI